jgi:hypothetical protein
MPAEVILFQPGNLAPIGLEDAGLALRIPFSRTAAIGTTRILFRWLPLGDTLLQNGRREQIASLDTFVLQFRESHRAAIRVQASPKYFPSFPRKLNQSIPLCC